MQIQAIGAPYDVVNHHSSNSNQYPNNFKWVMSPEQIQVVHDMSIIGMIDENYAPTEDQIRFGWICESNTVVPQLIDLLREHHEAIFDTGHYEAIFTCDKSLCELDDRFVFSWAGSNLPWTNPNDYKIYDKTKLCSMIASPKGEGADASSGHGFRINCAKKFKNSLDLFGGALGTERIGFSSNLNEKWHNKADALNDYMFSVVIENGSYDAYYTEKITDAFATGTVPIYHGSPGIGEIFNEDGIIYLDDDFKIEDLNEDLYMSKMDAIKDNFERVNNLESSDDMIHRNILSMVEVEV
jgi:hypothetical protein|tara:strand:- start:15097 stop:15987 length:891 start_codon:yes stop_codon:yes gene_type:complete